MSSCRNSKSNASQSCQNCTTFYLSQLTRVKDINIYSILTIIIKIPKYQLCIKNFKYYLIIVSVMLAPNCLQENISPFLQISKGLTIKQQHVSLNTKIKCLSLPIPSCPLRKVKLRKGRRSVFTLHTSFLQFNQGQGEVGSPISGPNRGQQKFKTKIYRGRKVITIKQESDWSYRYKYTAMTHWYKILFRQKKIIRFAF